MQNDQWRMQKFPASSRRLRRRRGRVLARFTAALTGLFAVFIGLSIWWTFLPSQDDPERVDVLLVLGPHAARMTDAEAFMDAGRAETLVIATFRTQSPECTEEAGYDYPVICFPPEPGTTQGEAIALRDMAQEFGWDSAAVMTVDHHLTRSRLHMNRCFDGDLYMVGVEAEGLWGGWLRTYFYQNAGILHALVSPECEGAPPDWLEDTREWAKDTIRN